MNENQIFAVENFSTDSIKIVVQLKFYKDKKWIAISKMKKWVQDQKFHFSSTVMIEFDEFKQNILPALIEICEKIND